MLHQALSGYATLGESLKDRVVAVDTAFDVKLIDEAKAHATKLAEAPAAPPPAPAEVEQAVLIRNGLLALLVAKKGLVRKCAARVFKDHPEIVREVTSAYERRRRAAARRAKAKAEAKKATGGEEAKKNP